MKKTFYQFTVCLLLLAGITPNLSAQWRLSKIAYPLGNWKEVGASNNIFPQGKFIDMEIGPNDEIYVLHQSNKDGFKIARASKTSSFWTVINTSFNGEIRDIEIDQSGNLYAAGGFTNARGFNYVAKYAGGSWQELGGKDSSDFRGVINNIHADYYGFIYCVGGFITSDVNPSSYVAKFENNKWSMVGSDLPVNNGLTQIEADLSGNLLVGGLFLDNDSVVIAFHTKGSDTWTPYKSALGGCTNFAVRGTSIYMYDPWNVVRINGIDQDFILRYDFVKNAFDRLIFDSSRQINRLVYNPVNNSICGAVRMGSENKLFEIVGNTFMYTNTPFKYGNVTLMGYLNTNETILAGNFANDYSEGSSILTSLRNFVPFLGENNTSQLEEYMHVNPEPISIHPNPSTGVIAFSDYSNVLLSNNKGQIIMERKNVRAINISNQSAGIYFLTFTDKHGFVIQRSKIIKE